MSPHFVTAVSQEPEERRQRCREICEAVARHIELFYADKYLRLNRVRILDKIRSSRQLHICPLDELARSAGRYETLAINLKRHAEQCMQPNIKIGIERLATAEAEQANALRKLLLARGCPGLPPRRVVQARITGSV